MRRLHPTVRRRILSRPTAASIPHGIIGISVIDYRGNRKQFVQHTEAGSRRTISSPSKAPTKPFQRGPRNCRNPGSVPPVRRGSRHEQERQFRTFGPTTTDPSLLMDASQPFCLRRWIVERRAAANRVPDRSLPVVRPVAPLLADEPALAEQRFDLLGIAAGPKRQQRT